MPMILKEDRAYVLFGSGDIALCPATEIQGVGRHYVVFQECSPGRVGLAAESGRRFPIERGHVPGEQGPFVLFEFETAESTDAVIAALQEFRRLKFGGSGEASACS